MHKGLRNVFNILKINSLSNKIEYLEFKIKSGEKNLKWCDYSLSTHGLVQSIWNIITLKNKIFNLLEQKIWDLERK